MDKINKETLSAEIGHVIDISLESMMGSTGYGWQLEGLNGCVNLLDIRVQNSSRRMGPIEQIFSFIPTGTGKAVVTFVLAASWKEEGEPVKTIEYQITVDKQSEENIDLDKLKVKGFVSKPEVSLRQYDPTMLYAVQMPSDLKRSSGTIGDIRLKYGIPIERRGDLRLKYGVLTQGPGDGRLKYGIRPQTQYNIPGISSLYNVRPNIQGLNTRMYYGYPINSANMCTPMIPYGFPNPCDPNYQCDPCDDPCDDPSDCCHHHHHH